MDHQIKYISIGRDSVQYNVPEYQLSTIKQQIYTPQQYIKNSLTNFSLPHIEAGKTKELFQKNSLRCFELDEMSNSESLEFNKSIILRNTNNSKLSHPNMVCPQIINNNNNWPNQSYYKNLPQYTNESHLRTIQFNKSSLGYQQPSNRIKFYAKSITRCCCCGRNRLYDQSYTYEKGDVIGNFSDNQNFTTQRRCFNESNIFAERRVIQYKRQEVIIPEKSLIGIQEVSKESIYTQVSGNKNIYPRQSLSNNKMMYHSLEKPKDEFNKNPRITTQPTYSNFTNLGNLKVNQQQKLPLISSPFSNISQNRQYPNGSFVSLNERNKVELPCQRPTNKNHFVPLLVEHCNDSEKDSDYQSDDSLDINTQELSRFVSDELKKYAISQSTFARNVLNRSQGTLSDMLRNPKPWNQLKVGKITFVRMHEWSCLPQKERFRMLIEGGKFMAPERRKRRIKSKIEIVGENSINK